MLIEGEIEDVAEWQAETGSTISEEIICYSARTRGEGRPETKECLVSTIRGKRYLRYLLIGKWRYGMN